MPAPALLSEPAIVSATGGAFMPLERAARSAPMFHGNEERCPR
jgi:hypothetical protein